MDNTISEGFTNVSSFKLLTLTGHAIHSIRFDDDPDTGESVTTVEDNGDMYTWRSALAIRQLKRAFEQHQESNIGRYREHVSF